MGAKRGDGVYFSTSLSFATQYSPTCSNGFRQVLLDEEVTDEYCVGNPNFRVAPVKPVTNEALLTDLIESKRFLFLKMLAPTLAIVFAFKISGLYTFPGEIK